MEIFLLLFSLETGMIPRDGLWMYNPYAKVDYEFSFENQHYYTKFESEIDIYKMFFIGGNVRTLVKLDGKNLGFTLLNADYMLYAGFKFNENLEIGFRHYCSHPVLTYAVLYDTRLFKRNFEGFYEELYIKVKGQVTF